MANEHLSPSLAETCQRDRSEFLERLRTSRGYRRIQAHFAYEPAHLANLEEYCWRCHGQAIRLELRGTRARRTLVWLSRFEAELGDPCWLPAEIVSP
jgi:hypothetical protein